MITYKGIVCTIFRDRYYPGIINYIMLVAGFHDIPYAYHWNRRWGVSLHFMINRSGPLIAGGSESVILTGMKWRRGLPLH